MPFKKGNQLYRRRKRQGSGRPTRQQVAIQATAQQKALWLIEQATEKVMKRYLIFAQKNAATARHYVDKLLPEEYEIGVPNSATIEIRVLRKNQSVDGTETEVRPDRDGRFVRVSR